MKKLFFILAASLALAGCKQPEEEENPIWDYGDFEEISWVMEKDGTLSFYGEGGIPDSQVNWSWYLQLYLTNITKVVISDGITGIGHSVLYNCVNVEHITIPASLTEFERSAIIGCTSLADIEIDADNENFSSENGVLFDKDKTTLLAHPAAKDEYAVPDGVTKIAVRAFYVCDALTAISIPASVTEIEEFAFYGCYGLENVTIMRTTPPDLNWHSLNFTAANDTLYVPAGCREAYSGWEDMFEHIVELP